MHHMSAVEPAEAEPLPEYLRNNPWVEILRNLGREEPTPPAESPSLPASRAG